MQVPWAHTHWMPPPVPFAWPWFHFLNSLVGTAGLCCLSWAARDLLGSILYAATLIVHSSAGRHHHEAPLQAQSTALQRRPAAHIAVAGRAPYQPRRWPAPRPSAWLTGHTVAHVQQHPRTACTGHAKQTPGLRATPVSICMQPLCPYACNPYTDCLLAPQLLPGRLPACHLLHCRQLEALALAGHLAAAHCRHACTDIRCPKHHASCIMHCCHAPRGRGKH
jgi:hypothetical protein